MRLNSKRLRGSRRPVDAVGAAPGPAVGGEGRLARVGPMRGGQNGDVGSDRAHAEKAATFTGTVTVVVLATGMMVGRPILMHMDEPGILVVIGQTMRRDATLAKSHDGGRRRQTKRIKHDKQTRRAPTPFDGQPNKHTRSCRGRR